jgi:hypothetical protein
MSRLLKNPPIREDGLTAAEPAQSVKNSKKILKRYKLGKEK